MNTHNQEELSARCLSNDYVKNVYERLKTECAKDSNAETTLSVTIAGVMDSCIITGQGEQLIAEFRLSVVSDMTRLSPGKKDEADKWISAMIQRSACIPVDGHVDSFRVWFRRPIEGFSEAVQARSEKSIGYANINSESMNIGIKKAVDDIYDYLLQNKEAAR